MKRNKGFTVIELLGAIVILGVISLIAIGSYTSSINKAKKTAYAAAEDSMKNSTKNAFTDCMINQGNSFLCNLYGIPAAGQSKKVFVEDLYQGNFMKRIDDPEKEGELCDSLRSYVLVTGSASTESGNKNLAYKSCLLCSGYQTAGCTFDEVSGKDFRIQVQMKTGSSTGVDYYSQFTKENVWIKVTAQDPYELGIKRYEYATNEKGPWSAMTGSTMTWSQEGLTKLYIRVIDNTDQASAPYSTYIKIDRTAPTAEFDIKGTLGNGNWYTSNVTIGVKNQSDGDGSGVASARVDVSSIMENTPVAGKTVTMTVVDNLGNTRTYQKVIKVDKSTPPTGEIVVNGTLGANGWYTSNVTISAAGVGVGNSGYTVKLSHTALTENTEGTTVTLSITSGSGLTTTTTKIIKIDKTPPTVGKIEESGTMGANGWYTSDVRLSTSGGSAGLSGFTNTLSHTTINYNTAGVTVTLTTRAGNGLTATTTKLIKVDKAVPVVGQINVSGTLGTNGWYTTDVSLSASGGTGGLSGVTNSLSKTSITTDTTGTVVTLTTKGGNGLYSTTTKMIKVDKTPPSIPTSGGISLGTIGEASSSSDPTSGVDYYYLVTKSSTPPSQADAGWSTNRSFATDCGTTYYGYSMAINGAGLKSQIRSHGSVTSTACCTLPAIDSVCTNPGEQQICQGVTRTCATLDGGGPGWVLTSGTLNGATYGMARQIRCNCFNYNGTAYNTGAGYSARLSEANTLLTDYYSDTSTSPFGFTCRATCIYRWK